MKLINSKSIIAAIVLAFGLNATQFTSAQEWPMKPSDEHSVLKDNVGTWDVKISLWMAGPDADATGSEGVETVKMLGDFWAVTDIRYEFMGEEALGHGLIGYDPSLEKYVGRWHESGSPYFSDMEGDYDKDTKTMTFLMTGKDPEGNELEYQIVMQNVDKKHRTFEMRTKMPGSDDFTKIMLMEYTKK